MLRKSDSKLRRDVLDELEWDSRVEWPGLSGIDVSVKQGVVTLRGTVSSQAGKKAAQEAARHVAGVLDVANEIEVRTERRYDDAELARAVRHVLEWDVSVPDERIQLTVADGWVTLEGEVYNLREREDAENVALKIRGVVGVVNKLAVAPREAVRVDAGRLRSDIEGALERRAEREAERLRVEVQDGVVELHGRVHSWQERRAVVGSVSHAPGVREVKDRLRIDPYF